jgi:type IV secretory pathway TrbF-like protein
MPGEHNPYLAARHEFMSTYADLARGKRNWQLCAFGLLVLLGGVLLAYLRLSGQSRITPYVVEVDRLGQAVAFGPAEALRPKDTRMTMYQLATFIRDLRTVSSDVETERQLLYAGYAFAAGAARAALDEYFINPAHDPRVLGRSLTRQVEITSLLPLPKSKTWKVSWREIERPRVAGAARTVAWEAYLTVAVNTPTTTEALLKNPTGLFVTDLSWSEVTTGDSR